MGEIEKKIILDESGAHMKMRRMAYEILENNAPDDVIILIGIAEKGFTVASHISKMIREINQKELAVLSLQIDKDNPTEVRLDKQVNLNGNIVVLVDDVTNSGRTLTYALKPLLEVHPKKIQTLVLAERSHKKFPVHADFVGMSISTLLQEHIHVDVKEGRVLGAYITSQK